MKLILLFFYILIFSSSVLARSLPSETFQRLQKIYPEQTKEFIELRFKNAQSVFDKWRSFPPYFYEMVKRSKSFNNLSKREGYCTGDPHIENFGFLPLKKDSVHFGINDLDDSTKCSLDLDLIRLYMAHRFYGVEFQGESFYKNYQSGLSGQACSRPKYVKELEKNALKKGREISKKALKMLEEKSCSGEFSFVPQEEITKIIALLEKVNPLPNQKNWKLLHACSRFKNHGGSAGEKRFVLFMQDTVGGLHHIELKPLTTPAPQIGSQLSLNQRSEIFTKAVDLFYGKDLLNEYFTVIYQNKLFQRRPLWAGVQEVSREDLEKLPTEEKQEVLDYEACTLGGLHFLSASGPLTLDFAQMQALSSNWEQQFRLEMGH